MFMVTKFERKKEVQITPGPQITDTSHHRGKMSANPQACCFRQSSVQGEEPGGIEMCRWVGKLQFFDAHRGYPLVICQLAIELTMLNTGRSLFFFGDHFL